MSKMRMSPKPKRISARRFVAEKLGCFMRLPSFAVLSCTQSGRSG